MRRELIRKVSGCFVLVVILLASSAIRGETAPPTPDVAQAPGRDSITLKLDPDTQKLLQRLADSRETPSAKTQDGDSWDKDKFTTLMSTLWQAPLAILAIVLAIGGFFGLQGYRELRESLSKQLKSEVEHTAALTIATGHLDSALTAWELSLDLASVESGLSEGQIDRQVPPKVFRETALAHLRAAKKTARLAVTAVGRIPSDVSVRVRGRSKELIGVQARQSYAYYIASDPESKDYEFVDALKFSEEAVQRLDDSEWMKREGVSEDDRGSLWVDTFLYIRIIYADKIVHQADYEKEEGRKQLRRAEQELLRARERWVKIQGRATYDDVIHRFG